ncbi:protein kinase domain-containing protein [Microbulbifer sp. YPW16]|uniref:protein kinase domain-containing protein n=1 Tax=Microbulbifer sp. YPW16 TaxID=2904242 RepID=UPI001E4FF884|nr:protein kinase [Microbulbifer sp. YPW16]UHQ53730.1 protein kinase [Microbulbifer sp. YPW16]
MAKLLQVGKPANDAEKWAFDFLKKELPEHYIIVANVDVYSDHGQPFECDAIIVGDWAIYIVDVKGYQGRLSAGKDVWLHGSRSVENPLPKLHQNARTLASRCRLKLRQNQHAPWCQGVAFITGGLGGEIALVKGENSLPVYHKSNIIQALTSPNYVTAFHKHKLQESQKEIALSAICDFKLLREQEQKVGNYTKKKLLSIDDDMELWVVEPEGHTFNFQYWMKFVDISGKSSSKIAELRARLKKEFYLLSELADLPAVPAALSYHDDGESIALVHQNIVGHSLSELDHFDKRRVMLDVASALIEMSKKGIHHRALSLENIFLSDDGKVQLLDVGYARSRQAKTLVTAGQLENPWLPPEYIESGVYTTGSLSYQFAHIFLPRISSNPPASASTLDFVSERYCLEKSHLDPSIAEAFEWLSGACNIDESVRPQLEDFIECFGSEANESSEIEEFRFRPGAKINDKYELIDCIGRGGTSSIWRAKHLLGEYICCLKVVDTFDGADQLARKEFEVLRVLYHPHIVRIFDLDVIHNSDQYFLTCEYLEGDTLDQTEFSSSGELLNYFRQILSALQYLHRLGRIHKDIKPENIIISHGNASIIDFNISMLDSRLIGTTRYKDPTVKASGWTYFSDIYSLVVTFAEALSKQHPFVENDDIPSVDCTPQLMKTSSSFPAVVRSKFDQVLRGDVNWDGIQDYCSWFGISDRLELEIPERILIQWNINKGYMLKVLKCMLADMQPRSRQVIVRNTLKANDIVGNKPNKKSVSSAISALKSSNVVEEHGAKIRLTNSFLQAWEDSQPAFGK